MIDDCMMSPPQLDVLLRALLRAMLQRNACGDCSQSIIISITLRSISAYRVAGACLVTEIDVFQTVFACNKDILSATIKQLRLPIPLRVTARQVCASLPNPKLHSRLLP